MEIGIGYLGSHGFFCGSVEFGVNGGSAGGTLVRGGSVSRNFNVDPDRFGQIIVGSRACVAQAQTDYSENTRNTPEIQEQNVENHQRPIMGSQSAVGRQTWGR
jgi:hypothetical protein